MLIHLNKFKRQPISKKKSQIKYMVLFLTLFILITSCQSGDEDFVTSAVFETSTITFAAPEYQRQGYEAAIQAFNEQYPSIRVQFITLDEILGDQASNPNMRQLASVADTIVLNRPFSVEATSFFLDIESFIATDNSFNIADFWPGLIAGCQTGERLAALPITVSPNLLLFDKAVFDKVGLPQPEPGWTWTDFQNAVQSLTQVDEEQVLQYGFVDHGRPLALLGPLVDNVMAANNLDTGAMANALNWYVTLVREGSIPTFDSVQTAFVASETLVNGRQAALWMSTLLEVNQKRDLFGNDLGIAPYPIATDATKTTPAFPTCAAISAGTAYPQAAWTWLNFLTRYSVSGTDRSIPARPSVAAASGYWDNLAEETAVTLRYALEHAWYGNFNPSLQPIAETLSQVLSGNADLETAWLTIAAVPPTVLPPTPDDNSISVATPRPTAVPLPVTDQTATISYFVDGNFHSSFEVVAALAETFNQQNAGIIVQVSEDETVFGGGSGAPEVGQYYDCFAHTGSAGALLTSEAYNLDPFFVAEPGGFRDDFDNVALETTRIDGVLFGLPVSAQPQVIYYNADHLQNLGLTPPSPEWTVSDFWELADAAAMGKGSNRIYGFVPYGWQSLDFLLADARIQIYDGSTSPARVYFDDPAVQELLTWLTAMVNDGIMFPADDGGTRSMLGNTRQRDVLTDRGQAAMWTNQAGLRYGFYTDPEGPDFTVGVAPLPTNAPLSTSPVAGIALYISRQAQNPAACWEWIKFLSAQPNVFRGIPVRRSVMNSAAWETAVGFETARAYRAALSRPVLSEESAQQPPMPIIQWWQDILVAVFSGANVAGTVLTAQIKADTMLNCVNTAGAMTDDYDKLINCAQQSDPQFKTRDELYQQSRP